MRSRSDVSLMVLDCSSLGRKTTANMLNNLGITRVLLPKRVEEAWRMLKENASVEVVITELFLPAAQDGVQFVRNVRNLKPDLPVFVLSSCSEKGLYVEVSRAGARECLTKPTSKEVLEDRLQNHIELPPRPSFRIGDFMVKKQAITRQQRDTALEFQELYGVETINMGLLALLLRLVDRQELAEMYLDGQLEEETFLESLLVRGHPQEHVDQLRETKQMLSFRLGEILVLLGFISKDAMERYSALYHRLR